jgi:hypothetical protein
LQDGISVKKWIDHGLLSLLVDVFSIFIIRLLCCLALFHLSGRFTFCTSTHRLSANAHSLSDLAAGHDVTASIPDAIYYPFPGTCRLFFASR